MKAAAMLTNSNSHCWTHHLLMLHGSPSLPSLSVSLSLPIPLSPALARISLFCSLSRSLLLGPVHSRDNSWVGGAAVAHGDMCECAFRACVCARARGIEYPSLEVKKKQKNGISHLNDGDGDQRRGEELLNGSVIDSQARGIGHRGARRVSLCIMSLYFSLGAF